MKKLSTVLAVAALSLGMMACKKKKDDGADNMAPKTDEGSAMAKPDDKMAKPDDHMAKPADGSGSAMAPAAGSGAAPAAAGGGDLPQECQDYKGAMEKLASCDKMPQASKDALKQGYDAMSQGWANISSLPPEAKKAMADGCKQGTDALMQSGKALCGW